MLYNVVMFGLRHLTDSAARTGSVAAAPPVRPACRSRRRTPGPTFGGPLFFHRAHLEFLAPLFSHSCKLLLPQPACFEIDTKHPGVPPPPLEFPLFSAACILMTSTTRPLSRYRANRGSRQSNDWNADCAAVWYALRPSLDAQQPQRHYRSRQPTSIPRLDVLEPFGVRGRGGARVERTSNSIPRR